MARPRAPFPAGAPCSFRPVPGRFFGQPADEQDDTVILDRRKKDLHPRSRYGDGADSEDLPSPRVSACEGCRAKNQETDSADSQGFLNKHVDRSGSRDQVELELLERPKSVTGTHKTVEITVVGSDRGFPGNASVRSPWKPYFPGGRRDALS
ncbi:hypothetical protein VTG60DRAFT_4388 [Thermothelomyces hinnuleus]